MAAILLNPASIHTSFVFLFFGCKTVRVWAFRYPDIYLILPVLLHYYNQNSVPPDGTAAGTVTFITPEYYPHCLWEGKRLPIKEGARTVGYVTVTKVLNPLLKKQE